MSQYKYAEIADTVYFWFAANDTTGAAGDGASPLFDVRLAGAASDAAPTASGTPTLLSHANYGAGLHEIAIDTTGYSAGEYAVFCTLTISTVNPGGFVGSFKLSAAGASLNSAMGLLAHADYGLAKLVRSTTPANALDVSATGEAGLDFANIKDATGAHTLTNITVPAVTTVGTCTTNSDMRGTDSAALASVCTEARLSELDAANLPTDVAAIPTNPILDTEDGSSFTALPAVTLANGAHGGAGATIVLSDYSNFKANVTNLDAAVSSRSSHSAADAATAVFAFDPTTVTVGASPNSFAKFIQGLWNRAFKKRTATADTETAYETDNVTTMETWTLTDDDTTASRTP